MRYLPKSDSERQEMLAVLGLSAEEDLVSYLSADVRFDGKLDLENGKSEYEIVDYFKARAARNANGYASFLGAGVYNHYRPVLCDVSFHAASF